MPDSGPAKAELIYLWQRKEDSGWMLTIVAAGKRYEFAMTPQLIAGVLSEAGIALTK